MLSRLPRTVLAVSGSMLSLLCTVAFSDDRTAVESRLTEAVKFLASDELEGRGVGTSGLDKAAAYLEAEFSKLGLQTSVFDGRPFQELEVTVKAELGPREQNRLVFVGPQPAGGGAAPRINVELGQGFNTLAIGGTQAVSAPLIFVGYGITAKDAGFDEYEGLDVQGKVVLILRKEPQQDNPHSAFEGTDSSRHAFFGTKISNAFEHGAAAVILVNDQFGLEEEAKTAGRHWEEAVNEVAKVRAEFQKIEQPSDEETKKHRAKINQLVERIQSLNEKLQGNFDEVLPLDGAGAESSHKSLPVFFARRADVEPVVRAATGKSLAAWEEEIDAGPTAHSQPLTGWSVECESNVVFQKATIKNVVAVLEGQGPLANETVVIGAHYDHLGEGGPGSLAPWTKAIHNGADDNASGTAALVEVARDFATRGSKPARRLVFIAFSGEERGLLGSSHYIKHPAFPLETTIAMVNMDMVGRLQDNKLIVYGTGTAESFDALIDETNQRHKFEIKKDPGGFGPSDHAAFYGKQIPVFHFFTGTHNDYHRPSDDVEKVDVAGMGRIVSMVVDVVDQLASQPDRPKYVEVKGRPGASGDRPYFGSIPDFGREVEGYALMGVAKDSPAERAGIKGGDVIVQFGESKIAGLEDIDGALRKYKAGDEVKVIVLRDNERVEVTVTLDPPR